MLEVEPFSLVEERFLKNLSVLMCRVKSLVSPVSES